jgi:hypothetical protein
MNAFARIDSLLWLASPMAAWSQASNMPATVPRPPAPKQQAAGIATQPSPRKRARKA